MKENNHLDDHSPKKELLIDSEKNENTTDKNNNSENPEKSEQKENKKLRLKERIINTDSKENQKQKQNLATTAELDPSNSDEIEKFRCDLIDTLNKKNFYLQPINLVINKTKKTINIEYLVELINDKTKTKDKKEDVDKKNNNNSEEKKYDFIPYLTINQIDFISFKEQEDIDNEIITNIQNNLLSEKIVDNRKTQFSETENVEGENPSKELISRPSVLNDKQICSINYTPLIPYSSCNCCRCFFCCECTCSKKYSLREFHDLFFLLSQNQIPSFKKSLYEISLPKLHELEAKNRKRKVLAFINPISGKGFSLQIWAKAKTYLLQANLDIDEIITQRFKEAYEYMLTVDPEKYDTFVTCSGDGIIHEIINAIFHRTEEDRDKFLNRCTLAALPAGSGNAVSKSISLYCGDDNSLETHCYYICKGIRKKIDLQELELRDVEKKVYSILGIYFGFLADCDLESEALRCLGMFRTTIEGFFRVFCLRDYIGAYYYMPTEATDEELEKLPKSIKENISEEDEKKFGLIKENDQWNMFICTNIIAVSEDILLNPDAKIDDGYSDNFVIPSRLGGRWTMTKYLLFDMDPGEIRDKNGKLKSGYDYHKSKWWRLIPKKRLTDPDDVNPVYHWSNYFSIDGERYPVCPIQSRSLNKIIPFHSGKE